MSGMTVINISLVLLGLAGNCLAQDQAPISPQATPLAFTSDSDSPESPAEIEDIPEADPQDNVPFVQPTDICLFTADDFFAKSFEDLVELVNPGAGSDGTETLFCEDSEETNPGLLAEYKQADTNQDEELELVEFEAWKAARKSTAGQ